MKEKLLFSLIGIAFAITSCTQPVDVPKTTLELTQTPSAKPTSSNTPQSMDNPIKASMWCDLWVYLDGPTGDLASRNPSFEFEAEVQGGNAAQVVVESPSKEIFTLPPYRDIPYGREQRFGNGYKIPGLPQIGRPYLCTALDVTGTPIPGVEAFEVYVGGNEPDPPTDVRAEIVEAGILVSWKPSHVIPGAFDPGGSPPIGHYVVFLFQEGGKFLYGWNSGISLPETSHLIPLHRQDFSPEDAGLSLEELDDGIYFVHVYARSVAPEGTNGRKDECWAEDSSQSIRLVIEGGQMLVEAP
jgi:hypothetical protein